MYLTRALACAGAVLVSALAAPATAADVPADVQKTLAADYQLNCTVSMDPSDKNFAAADAILAPDFAMTDIKGKAYSRSEMIAQAKQQLKMIHITNCTNDIQSQTMTDANTIVIVASGHQVGDLQAPDGKHDLDATTKTQDTWKNVNGTWLLSSSKELRVLVKMDGNVVQDQGE